MQKVRGSNPLSSTIFRMPVRGKSAKLLALDHGLTWANAELRTAALYAECQGPNLSGSSVMHAQHPNDPDPAIRQSDPRRAADHGRHDRTPVPVIGDLAPGTALFGLMPNGPPVGLGCETEMLPERPREVTLVEKACLRCDLRDGVLGVGQPRGSPTEPQSPHIGADRGSVLEAEDPGQVHRMHADRIGHLCKPQVVTVAVVQQCPGLAEPVGRPTFSADGLGVP